ncbi:MAG: polyprenyl synthetase family protein [SAR324 cluster bacterium]|nr:polyprenyl synthetase family protein [SAR324 cluster bacterium]
MRFEQILGKFQEELRETREFMISHVTRDLGTIKGSDAFAAYPTSQFLRSIILFSSATDSRNTTLPLSEIASVLEYLHLASKLHRHIPQIDEFRRLNKEIANWWHNELSILAGDYFLSISFKILTQLGNMDLLELISNATRLISQGQVLEIANGSGTSSEQIYFEIAGNKTGSLAAAAAVCGSISDNSDMIVMDSYYEFGFQLGIALQIHDDAQTCANPQMLEYALRENKTLYPICCLLNRFPDQQETGELLTHLHENHIQSASQLAYRMLSQLAIMPLVEQEISSRLQKASSSLSKPDQAEHLMALCQSHNFSV